MEKISDELLKQVMSAIGSRKSEAKAAASIANGQLGGRPELTDWVELPDGRWKGTRDGVTAEGASKAVVRGKLRKIKGEI